MDKLIKVLKKIDSAKVAEEVRQGGSGQSPYLFSIISKAYPKQEEETVKKIFKAVWCGTILRSKTISHDKFIELFKETTPIIQALYPNKNSSETLFSKLRKCVKDRYGEESQIYTLSVNNMGLSKQEKKERSDIYAAKVAERNERRGEMEPVYVDDILSIVDRFKTDRDPFKRMVAVLIATGLRGIEVFKVSIVKKVSESEIEVSEMAKRGNGKKAIRPVIGMTADEAIEGIKFIRDNLNTSGDNEAIESRLNQPLNQMFKKIVSGMTSQKGRYLYGNITFKLYGEPKKIPYESYIGKVLGHDSAQSTRSYLAINLEEGKSDNPPQFEEPDSFDQFKNNMRRGVPDDVKVANIVGALTYMKDNKIYITQADLRKILGYSARIMTKAYGVFRN